MDNNTEQLKQLEKKTGQILLSAGKFILDSWNKIESYTYKDKRDLSTDVDVKVEEILRRELGSLLPNAGFIVEEGISSKDEEYSWVIDPIDATKNYASKLPMFVTQIALLYKDEPILAQVYNPVSQQFFSASKGNGTTLNDTPVAISKRSSMDEAIIEVDFGGKDATLENKLVVLQKLFREFYRVKVSGACLFSAYILTGAIDAFIILDPKIKSVDFLPYFLLFKETGLQVRELEFAESRIYLVSNPSLMDQLLNLLKTG